MEGKAGGATGGGPGPEGDAKGKEAPPTTSAVENKATDGEGKVVAPSAPNLFELHKAEGNGLVKQEKFEEALQMYELAWKEASTTDEKAMILNNKGVVAEKMVG